MEPSPFKLTEAAKKQIEDTAFAYGLGRFAMRVRLNAKDATKGFDLAVEEFALPEDLTFVEQGLRFHIARELVPHVRGVVIDYVHAGRQSGFVFRRADR